MAESGLFCGSLDHSAEGVRVNNGQVGEHFTIQFNGVFVQASNEATVVGTVLLGSSVDAYYPQAAEFTFFVTAIPVGKAEGAVYRFSSGFIQPVFATTVALGKRQYLVSSPAGFEAAGSSRHIFLRM
jgi:hypothetical protein